MVEGQGEDGWDGEEHVRQLDAPERVGTAVVEGVAAVTNRSPLDLPPLQDVVDLDAVDQLFASAPPDLSLTFEYAGCEVTVEPERIRVRDRRAE